MLLNIYNNPHAGLPTTFSELREIIQFAPFTVNVINKGIRDIYIQVDETLPDLSVVTIRVKDAVTNDPVTDAVVYAWNIKAVPTYTPESIPVNAGTVPGDYASTWPFYSSMG